MSRIYKIKLNNYRFKIIFVAETMMSMKLSVDLFVIEHFETLINTIIKLEIYLQ